MAVLHALVLALLRPRRVGANTVGAASTFAELKALLHNVKDGDETVVVTSDIVWDTFAPWNGIAVVRAVRIVGACTTTAVNVEGLAAGTCKLDAQEGGRHFDVDTGSGATVVFEKLALVNGKRAGASGGALRVKNSGALQLRSVVFKDNKCGFSGGALYVERSQQTLAESCIFANNEAVLGGAIRMEYSVLLATNCVFRKNTASGKAGAASIFNSQTATFTNSTFASNTAGPNGGPNVYLESSRILPAAATFNWCKFLDQESISLGTERGTFGAWSYFVHFYVEISPGANETAQGFAQTMLLKSSEQPLMYREAIARRANVERGAVRLLDGRAQSDAADKMYIDGSLVECQLPMQGYCSAVLETSVGFASTATADMNAFLALMDSLVHTDISFWIGMPSEFGLVRVASKADLLRPLPRVKGVSPLFIAMLSVALLVLLLAAAEALALTPEACDGQQSASAARLKAVKDNKGMLAKLVLGLFDLLTDILFVAEARNVARVRPEFNPLFLSGLAFLCIPVFAGAAVCLRAVSVNKPLLHEGVVRDHAIVYALCLILASLNVEAIGVFPWKQREFDGFPLKYMLAFAYLTVVLEDVPQLVLQVLYVVMHGNGGSIAWVSIFFSLASISVRVLARGLVMSMSKPEITEPHEAGSEMRSMAMSAGTHTAGRDRNLSTSNPLWTDSERADGL